MSTPRPGLKRRIHLFEFEDLGWFPKVLRDTITRWLAEVFVGTYDPVAPMITRLLDSGGTGQVVDLCSGGTGPWEYLKPLVDAERTGRGDGPLALTLTDLYPNVPSFTQVAGRLGRDVDFVTEGIDARHVPDHLKGVRTLFSSFHHLDYFDARAVLADAAGAGQPIGIFEFTQRDWRVVGPLFRSVPVSMLGAVRTWRPRNWVQMFFTYVIPLTVLTALWDSVVSELRTYRPHELEAMAEGLGGDGYRWEAGVSTSGPNGPITYIIGYPVQPEA
jgi:hypothetical protein